jgi:S-adenosylmethionine:tRNA ribosyltransferase-isomerase
MMMMMALRPDDFDFSLPEGLIAQAPARQRDASRLLHLDRGTGAIVHRTFRELPGLLSPGDVLVFNESRVIPARLLGRKAGTGGRAELLLVRPAGTAATAAALRGPVDAVEWRCLGQSSKGFKPGTRLEFAGQLGAEVVADLGGGEFQVRFTAPVGTLDAALAIAGQLPLPPYITHAPGPEDAERYQTVYANRPGSVAAPTAGLHFTEGTLAELDRLGVERVQVVLEVGPGTFLPVREDDLGQHVMHAERCEVPARAASRLQAARREGRRVVAVGTTVVRTLESLASEDGLVQEGRADTRLFITPGYRFKAVDALLTNFHLPRSTLLMLVAAFAGHARTLAAYREAVAREYRFFSYGDAMFIEGAPR